MRVQGTVKDTNGVRPIPNAMIMAVRIKDSVLLGFARSNDDGTFDLKGFPVDTFSLVIDHPNFDEKTYFMFGHKDNYDITIPPISMPSKSQDLDEVIIYANKNPIFFRGDTLVYVADSFKVHEGAVAEDLLKRLPGISVDKDGNITSQGTQISKVLVDGDEFFGTDPTIATKNLGADGIETVEVYETENEDGIGSDDKIQVLDLKLKDDAKKGYFGRVSGASDFALTPINDRIGTNPFYEGELLFNRFNGAQKVSIFALTSNTPRSNFGYGDMNKFGLDNEGGGNRWEDNTSTNSGIPETIRAGVYFQDKWGKNNNYEFGGNYSYRSISLDATSASRSQYLLSDTTYFTEDSTRNFTKNQSHTLNLNFKMPLDSFTIFEIRPSFSYDIQDKDSRMENIFLNGDNIESFRSTAKDSTQSIGMNVSTMARIHRKFRKKRRELEFRYNLTWRDNQTNGNILNSTDFVVGNDTITDQRKKNYNNSISHYGEGTYFEPISKGWKMQFEYRFGYTLGKQDKETFGLSGVDYSSRVDGLSNIFETKTVENRGGMHFVYKKKKHELSIGSRLRNIDIQNINLITDTTITQNFTDVLPIITYRFKPSMSRRVGINYRTYARQPAIDDLQPVPDNTNPNRFKIGNPNLKPSYTHNLGLNFNNWQALTGRYVYTGINVQYTDNDFGSSITYDQFGRSISQTVNVDGNITSYLYAGGGIPVMKKILTLEPRINASYNKSTNFINTEKNITQNFMISGDFNLQFVWDSLEIEVFNNYSYNKPVNSLSTASNSPYTVQEHGVGVTWRLPLGFTIGAEGTYTRNAQQGSGFYNIEYFVLDAELSKSFLKTNNLVLSLIANDILNQNVNARREVTGNIITDYRTSIISRYFLLKLTYRFNNRKTKEEDFNGWH